MTPNSNSELQFEFPDPPVPSESLPPLLNLFQASQLLGLTPEMTRKEILRLGVHLADIDEAGMAYFDRSTMCEVFMELEEEEEMFRALWHYGSDDWIDPRMLDPQPGDQGYRDPDETYE